MRKVKHYFGQRRGKHHYGLVLDRPGLWAVPRLLRESFCQTFVNDNGALVFDLEADSDLWLGNQPLTPEGVCFLETLRATPAEVDPNPPVVPMARYCDYELKRSPETEAAYQKAVNKI